MTIEEFKKLDSGVTYRNISDFIHQIFPEFIQSDEYQYYSDEKDLIYSYLAGLSSFAFDNLDKRVDDGLAVRLLEFTNHVINKFGSSKNNENLDTLANLFGIEIFENLTGYRKAAHLAKKHLTGEALQSFHDTTMDYHTHEFLDEYYKVFNIHAIFAKDPESLSAYMWNELQRPNMGEPEDDEILSDIRISLELDEDLIAGTLSYLTANKKPPEKQIKFFYKLHKNFADHKERLDNHKAVDANKPYIQELLAFIDDLKRITTNTGTWMWNHGIK